MNYIYLYCWCVPSFLTRQPEKSKEKIAILLSHLDHETKGNNLYFLLKYKWFCFKLLKCTSSLRIGDLFLTFKLENTYLKHRLRLVISPGVHLWSIVIIYYSHIILLMVRYYDPPNVLIWDTLWPLIIHLKNVRQ